MNQLADQLTSINSLLRLAIQKLQNNKTLIDSLIAKNNNLLETFNLLNVDELITAQKTDNKQQTNDIKIDTTVLLEFKPLEYTVYEFKPLPKRNNKKRNMALKLIDDNIAKLQAMRNKPQLKGDPTFNSVFNRQYLPRNNYSVFVHKQNPVSNKVPDLFKIKYKGKNRPSIWCE